MMLILERSALARDLQRTSNEASSLGRIISSWFSSSSSSLPLAQTIGTRLDELNERINRTETFISSLRTQIDKERSMMENLREILQDIESVKTEINSKDTNDVDQVHMISKLKFETLPLLEQNRDDIVERIERFRVLSEHKTVLLTDTITPSHIMEAVALVTGIPTSKLSQSDRERLLSLRERLKKRVIGQDDAVMSLSNAVLRNRAGFSADARPSGSFLFLGSTGVGKTELAKALAGKF